MMGYRDFERQNQKWIFWEFHTIFNIEFWIFKAAKFL